MSTPRDPRARRHRIRAHRDRQQVVLTQKLRDLRATGVLSECRPLTETTFRVAVGRHAAEFCTRSGKWQTPGGRVSGRGWQEMVDYLRSLA